MEKVYTRLRAIDILKERNISIQELLRSIIRNSEESSLTYAVLYKIVMNQIRSPDIAYIGAIAQALGVSYSELIEDIPATSALAINEQARQKELRDRQRIRRKAK